MPKQTLNLWLFVGICCAVAVTAVFLFPDAAWAASTGCSAATTGGTPAGGSSSLPWKVDCAPSSKASPAQWPMRFRLLAWRSPAGC